MNKLSKFDKVSLSKSDQQKIKGGKKEKKEKKEKIKLTKEQKKCLKESKKWTNNGNGNGLWGF